jgi:hypothetical protein
VSTKIYVAYRLKKRVKLWAWVRKTRTRAVLEVRKELRNLYKMLVEHVDVTSERYKKALDFTKDDEYQARLEVAHENLVKEYRGQVGKAERDLFDFDVSLTLREHRGRVYVIPHCDMLLGKVLDFLKEDEDLEDYAYWDNTDMPEGMRRKEWKARGLKWRAIDKAGWGQHLIVSIVEPSGFYLIDPYMDLCHEHARQKKVKS